MSLRALLRPLCWMRGHRARMGSWTTMNSDGRIYMAFTNETCARCGAEVRVETKVAPNATGDMAFVTRQVVGPAATGWFE